MLITSEGGCLIEGGGSLLTFSPKQPDNDDVVRYHHQRMHCRIVSTLLGLV